MFQDLRRIVTGHNAEGRSVVMIDGPPPQGLSADTGGMFELWSTDSGPVISTDATDRAVQEVILSPEANGTKFRYFVMNPIPEGTPREAIEAAAAEAFKLIGASHERVDTTRHPGMHKTKTIDYIILLSGEAKLLLDDDEVQLKPFDVVVQRGTNHAWVVTGDTPALFIAVLIDAEIVE